MKKTILYLSILVVATACSDTQTADAINETTDALESAVETATETAVDPSTKLVTVKDILDDITLEEENAKVTVHAYCWGPDEIEEQKIVLFGEKKEDDGGYGVYVNIEDCPAVKDLKMGEKVTLVGNVTYNNDIGHILENASLK